MIFYKGFTLIEYSEENGDEDDNDFRIIAFSENKSELQPVLLKLNEKQKQKSDLKQEADNFIKLYENDWKKEICPKSKEDHERIRISKYSFEARTEYEKLILERKKIFTKTWVKNNPVPQNIIKLIEIDESSIDTKSFSELFYEIKKV
jgi:murein tripeptide amidase MpaA